MAGCMTWQSDEGMNEMSVNIITCLMNGDYLYDLQEKWRSDLRNVCYYHVHNGSKLNPTNAKKNYSHKTRKCKMKYGNYKNESKSMYY